MQWLEVEAEYAGQRIDNFLVARLKGVPKSVIYRCLRKGEVRVNKGRIKPDYRVQGGDLIRIPPLRRSEQSDDEIHVGERIRNLLEGAILYEDEGLIVLNKPAGMAVHGGSGVSVGVIEALRAIRPLSRHLELVHRLDRDTSGCLMVAKKRSRLRVLHEQLQAGEIRKVYWALVEGRWKGKFRRIDAPLQKFGEQGGERIVKVSQQGKPSSTEFVLLRHFEETSLVEASPLTGRTHQIRVHAQFAGHPIVGDDKYENKERARYFRDLGAGRMFLHAKSLEIPSDQGKMVFDAPLDTAFQSFIDQLGREGSKS
ncbi:Ribosomal large subunit pseudouridine synthase C [gamma proteobacterium HdN1]|nr:Ribosomal large subunit pseudouridine synthase C [gamma proteobacterium HdN1]